MKSVDLLFEVSWEVVNRVGGINTVIKSKAPYMKDLVKELIMIGPFVDKNQLIYLEKEEAPKKLKEVFQELEKEHGLKFYYGRWSINSEPKTILIDFSSLWSQKNEIKTWLWNNYGVDSLFSAPDFEPPVVWGWAVGLLVKKIVEKYKNKKIVLHAHEWLSGVPILYLKKHCKEVKTVFTTHATFLGRVISSAGLELYNVIDEINPDEKAREFHIIEKHTLEKASFLASDVATTVSNITALECEKFFGRKADVILENGIDAESFGTIEEVSLMHNEARETIREFVTYYFFPYYIFDLKHTLFYYFVGRYEIRDKGIDVVIKALGKLNERLKKENSKRTIVFFFFVPYGNRGISRELLENKDYYYTIKNFVNSKSKEILNRIIYDLVSKKRLSTKTLFTKEFWRGAKEDLWKFKREGNAPITTHELVDGQNNELLKMLIEEGLDNKPDDKVKVIFYPTYLSTTDGLLNLGLYRTMAGCHLGVFPSYYEPWGYTPLESMAVGVPAVASDTSGFGKAVEKLKKEGVIKNGISGFGKAVEKLKKEGVIKNGIYIIPRFGKNFNEVVDELERIMYRFASYDHAERVTERIWAKMNSYLFDWKHLIKNYRKAYELALSK